MYKVNNKPLRLDRAFTLGDIQYPANWLRLASAEDKAALGITEEADAVRADDRFYWNGDITVPKAMDDVEEVDEDGNPMYVKVLDNSDPANPVMVDSAERLVTKGLKSTFTAQVRATANSILASTDWMVIRKAERDVAIPEATVTYRAAILTECDRLIAAIAGAADVDALITVLNNQDWAVA
jgi:hypothetical protein